MSEPSSEQIQAAIERDQALLDAGVPFGPLRPHGPGRPANDDVIPLDEDGNPIFLAEPPAEGVSIPGSCLRVLNTPLSQGGGGECPYDCPGRQEDGGCLADIVRAAQAAGVEWKFDVRITEAGPIWVYTGEEIT